MEGKRIKPDQSILQQLATKHEAIVPFSRIPFFLQQYIATTESAQQIATVLQSVGEKELSYLQTKVDHIQHSLSDMTKDRYDFVVQCENSFDDKGHSNQKKLQAIAKQLLVDELGPLVNDIVQRMDIQVQHEPIDADVFKNTYSDTSRELPPEDGEHIRKEQQVRIIMNALIMGAGHRIFDVFHKESKYAIAVNKIDPSLYQTYYDMVYANLKHMWETPVDNAPWGVNTGSVQLTALEKNKQSHTHEDNAENNDRSYDVGIAVKADIFPVMLHEMAKGVMEYLAYARYSDMSTDVRRSILSVDSRAEEHRMMLVGPQIYKQFLFLIKEAVSQYDEQYGLVDGKKAHEYIVPLLSMIMRLPADELLHFTEQLLRGDGDGTSSIYYIHGLIEKMHESFAVRQKMRLGSKAAMTIDDIIAQLSKEFEMSKECKVFIETYLPILEEKLASAGFTIHNKKLARKLGEYFPIFAKQYTTEGIESAFLFLLDDTISGWKKSRIETAAFAVLRGEQKKTARKTKDNITKETIYVKQKFTLQQLRDAEKNLVQTTCDAIDDEVKELMQQGSIASWIKDHDDYSTKTNHLTAEFITLDDIAPECVATWEDNRGLYNLVNEEQLKRESNMMGGSCVDKQGSDIASGALVVLSLRHGTWSRWTIGYQPSSKTIIQVKGFTNGKKNSVLQAGELDFPHVMRALAEICEMYEVKKINDIHDDFLQGWVGFWGSKYHSIQAFIDRDNEVEQYHTVGIDIDMQEGSTTVRDPQTRTFMLQIGHTVDEKRFAMKSGDSLYYPRHVVLNMHIKIAGGAYKSLVMKKNEDGTYNEIFSGDYASINFSASGLLPGEGVTFHNDLKKSLIVKRGEQYCLVTDQSYDAIIFDHNFRFDHTISNQQDYILVEKDKKYGVIQRTKVGAYKTVVPCAYDQKIVFTGPRVMRVLRNEKFGMLHFSDNGIREEAVPCEYTVLGKNYEVGLYDENKRPYRFMTLTSAHGGVGLMRIKYTIPGVEFTQVVDTEYKTIGDEIRNDGLFADKYIIVSKGNAMFADLLGVMQIDDDATCHEILPVGKYKSLENAQKFQGDLIVQSSRGASIVLRRGTDGIYTEVHTFPGLFSHVGLEGSNLFWISGHQGGVGVYADGTYDIVMKGLTEMPSFGAHGLPHNYAWAKKGDLYGIISLASDHTVTVHTDYKFATPVSFSSQRAIITSSESNFSYILEYDAAGAVKETVLPFANVILYSGDKLVQKSLHGICYYQKNEFGGFTSVHAPLIVDKMKDAGMFGLDVDQFWASSQMKVGIVRFGQEGGEMALPCLYDAIGEFGVDGFPLSIARAMKDKKMGLIQKNDDGSYTEIVPCEYYVITYHTMGYENLDFIACCHMDEMHVTSKVKNPLTGVYENLYTIVKGTEISPWTHPHTSQKLYKVHTSDGYEICEIINEEFVNVFQADLGAYHLDDYYYPSLQLDAGEFLLRHSYTGYSCIATFTKDGQPHIVSDLINLPYTYGNPCHITKEMIVSSNDIDLGFRKCRLLRKDKDGIYKNILPQNAVICEEDFSDLDNEMDLQEVVCHKIDNIDHYCFIPRKHNMYDQYAPQIYKDVGGQELVPLTHEEMEKIYLTHDVRYEEMVLRILKEQYEIDLYRNFDRITSLDMLARSFRCTKLVDDENVCVTVIAYFEEKNGKIVLVRSDSGDQQAHDLLQQLLEVGVVEEYKPSDDLPF